MPTSTDQGKELKDIRRFDQLVAYLRDELHWPISTDDFEKLTFDFTAEELGIDMKNAAKVKEIKQLRPFSANQPWGIFFVNFEPKQLPVVALRRILGSLALKQRASANESDRKAWSQDDLLFVSNYGEGEERKICLAHFAQSDKKKDLPVLKVLGWDNLDTPLHLDHVADVLTEKLTWPSDGDDVDHWRSQWRSAFTLEHRETIKTSKQLAIALAELARNIRDRINTVLRIESEDGRITKLMSAFKEALVDDLDEDGFADMYAQTIAYGLLSARIANPKGDTADGVAAAMPVTNPFLKELLETFLHTGGRDTKNKKGIRLDFDELGVGDVVELLDAANMEEVVLDFGDKNPQEDPVIHFYELFLKEYDPKMRMARGVFYTPRPVVSFIVRSVDELLRTEFDLEDGLADTTTWGEMCKRIKNLEIPDGATPEQVFVQILDPATGTGTFLVEVIDLIHKTMTEKWKAAGHGKKKIIELWNEYVPEHLLPRLHGYELMMAPYAIAHMKIGLKLYETGYRFESAERARVYLTNALEPAQDFSGTLAFAIPALAHEAEAVNTIKRDQRFTVVIGNPPYSVMSGNLSKSSKKIVDEYRYVDGKKIRERGMLRFEMHIQNDYVKFLALAQGVLESSSVGLFGFITANGYFDNLTLRGVRNALITQFDSLSLLNLHGSRGTASRKTNQLDENVFDIESGVGIILASHNKGTAKFGDVTYVDIFASRKVKLEILQKNQLSTLELSSIEPVSEDYFFVPRDNERSKEFQCFICITDIMKENISGIVTAHDHLVVDFTKDRLLYNAQVLRDSSINDEQARDLLKVKDNAGWKLNKARGRMKADSSDEKYLKIYSYRPFDNRVIYYHPAVVWSDRKRVMSHVLEGENIALATCRQTVSGPWEHVFITEFLQDDCFISNRTRERSYHFPLFLKGKGRVLASEQSLFQHSESIDVANLNIDYLSKLTLLCESDVNLVTSMNVFGFIYAILFSPQYRFRYEESLRSKFPRLPIPKNINLFKNLLDKGRSLIKIHLIDSDLLNKQTIETIGIRESEIEKVSYSDETVWIDRSKTRGFKGIPDEVWNFHIGCYRVCEKWLKDRQAKGGKNPRPGRVLTDEDIEHYQKIVAALSETIRIMGEIDEVIEEHGGWPDAFATNTENKE